mgnify:CR=1 FL=1
MTLAAPHLSVRKHLGPEAKFCIDVALWSRPHGISLELSIWDGQKMFKGANSEHVFRVLTGLSNEQSIDDASDAIGALL